jgi:mycofactocin system creatininase family protein
VAGPDLRPDLADVTWTDLGERDAPLTLLVPVGSCEQHGPHLPIGADTLIAVALARDVADRRPRRFVAPALAITASGEHQGFPGTLSIGTEAMVTVLVELVRSAGWAQRVVLVNGHGGNVDAMRRAAAVFEHEQREVLTWWPDVAAATAAIGDARMVRGDLHAGHVETSLLLALHPELVRLDRAVAGPQTVTMADLVHHGVQAVSPSGVLGDPTLATADEGRRLFAALTEQLADAVDR